MWKQIEPRALALGDTSLFRKVQGQDPLAREAKYHSLFRKAFNDLPNIFCAGLDLKEVLALRKSKLVTFRKTFQDMWSRLYGSRLVTMAAIKGHAIAGGCVLSLACDYSVMASDFRIGLPELSLVGRKRCLKKSCGKSE
ncbi:predicted protein [Nematostella vectensis]|uniref:3-hydroxyisobutyryl-CoA hydrolase n=1 Tax=Nematostella vectensis TaxID=45351 RepID=A7T1Y9_NEMVE|nr:predicted protein [Nematostella vectensis]|eukprot:XP_001622122.1 predicted protein [Nematostella vectensis]